MSVTGVAAAASPYQPGWIDYNKNGRKDVFEDATQPLARRLDDLCAQMDLSDQLAQIRAATDADRIDPASLPAVGMVTEAAQRMSLRAATARLDALQHQQIERTKLGIPLLFIDEGLHGLRAPQASSFPIPLALAATWRPELMGRVASAIAAEAKSRGLRQVLSPVVDIGRDSRWGRTGETYGEDPFLVTRFAVEFCRAFESVGVATTPKHFVANSGEGGRDSAAQFIDQRLLNDLYYPPYAACIREAHSHSIMPSYGSLNGQPTVCSQWLLTEQARGQLGFAGYFGSDFGAVLGVRDRHHLTDSDAEVAALCLNAGMDVEWPRARFYGAPLDAALKAGSVRPETVAAAARRVLRVKFELGLFDSPFATPGEAERVTDSAERRALALESAREAIVLLKNQDHLLPLDRGRLKKVAVIGAYGESAQLGGYAGSDVKTVSLVDGLRQHLPGATVVTHAGVGGSVNPFVDLPRARINDGQGWKYSLWTNVAGSGVPAATGFEANVRRTRWQLQSKDHVQATRLHGEWSGKFQPESNVTADLLLTGTGTLRLTIDGNEVLNNAGTRGEPDTYSSARQFDVPTAADIGPARSRTTYTFLSGRRYRLQVAWENDSADPIAALEWNQRPDLETTIAAAVNLARDADAIVVVPGGLAEGEFRDRPQLEYPPEEVRLVTALAGLGKPLVAVLVNGSAVAISEWERRVPAILESWQDGEEQGNAIADALLGTINPGGRLPLTFPQFSAQAPLTYNYYPIGRVRGYQDPWKGRPQYPFGFGLSYTSFKYSNLRLSRSSARAGESVDVTCDVTNTGERDGDEVVQVYLHDDVASVVRPIQLLKGFQRVTVRPGETRTVTLTLTPDDLSLWNAQLAYVMEPRPMTILVGASSADIRLEGHLRILP